jgi:hypothetical protein
VREQERSRTGSVRVVEDDQDSSAASDEIVSQVPAFSAAPATAPDAAVGADSGDEDDDDTQEEVDVAPVSAYAAVEAPGEVPVDVVEVVSDPAAEEQSPLELLDQADQASDAVGPIGTDDDHDDEDDDVSDEERPVVSPAFGEGVLSEAADVPTFAPSFDELISSDSNGSQHLAPSTLIFTPSPGEGSLSGPVASTGEVLVTGSYELPQGIGSQGHAHGVADGKDIDSVLIDGELPPASSPTPIAASSAVSTIKPAGEVIRPPAPEKGNRLMLTLAITAGGLALALAVALIVAFTTNVF